MLRGQVRDSIESSFGSTLKSAFPVSGGDINEAYDVRLQDGQRIFVKTHRAPPDGMFEAEARGLSFLGETGALFVPEVRAVDPKFLALDFLESGPRVADFDQRLGRGLADLHRFSCLQFGGDTPNYIATLLQDNRCLPDWPAFYRERRIAVQLRLAVDSGVIGAPLRGELDGLMMRFEDLLGDAEPPSRLHGDLWGGNLHVSPSGEPTLIDPAAYGGHREMDLAMMKLFGGFSDHVFGAYDDAFPLGPGFRERLSLHQLYPLLVHVNLFGSSYLSSVERVIKKYR